MILFDKEIKLTGTNFLVNIILPEDLPNGLKNMARDPRKYRLKPDCYVGKVEEIGEGCQFVRVGDEITFERWEYQQQDVDDERLIARERDLIIYGNGIPMPDVMVMEILNRKVPKTNLTLPHNLRIEEPTTYYHGKILYLPSNKEKLMLDDVEIEKGDELFVEKYDSGQYKDAQGRLFFKIGNIAKVMIHLKRINTLELAII